MVDLTYYTLTVNRHGKKIWKYIKSVRQGNIPDETPNKEFCYPFSEYDNCEFYADTSERWSKFDHDMRKLSKAFPDVTFTLGGQGDNTNDFWIAEYQNTKVTNYHPEFICDDLKIHREPAFESHIESLSDICLRAIANHPVLINY